MDKKERIELIRKGNELFNSGDITRAVDIFEKTNYADGLVRAGDYLYYDKKMPLAAYKYYKMANCRDKIDEIFQRMIFALGKLVSDGGEEKPAATKFTLPPLKVSPKLKIMAEEILRNEKESQKNQGDAK
jgi:hypothetical protein